MTRQENIAKIRDILKTNEVDAFIVPTDDPHMSEYVAPYFSRREYVSGFTGSAGTVVLTSQQSVLFTDGRYHNQAEIELDAENWVLMKSGLKDVPTISEYLSMSVKAGGKVGFDPLVHSARSIAELNKILSSKNIQVKAISNPIDTVWNAERPTKPDSMLRLHPMEYAGKSTLDKFAEVRQSMETDGADYLVVTALDQIAWLLNVRASDIPCNPVSISYAVLGRDTCHLFIDPNKVSTEVQESLSANGVSFKPYEDMISFVQGLKNDNAKVWFDGSTANLALYQ